MSVAYLGILAVVGVLLLIAGIGDFRRKEISRRMLGVLMLVCFMGFWFGENLRLTAAIGGAAIGVCVIGISLASRDQIGRGDGVVIASIGLLLGFRGCLIVVCLSSLFMAVVSAGILILKKGNKNTRLPYIPALFLGYLAYIGSYIRVGGGVI